MKTILKLKTLLILIAVAAIGGAGFYVYQFDPFSFRSKPLVIDKTANVVTSVKQISEFVSMSYYEEMTLIGSKTSASVDNAIGTSVASFLGKKDGALMTDDIVLIARGKVRAGFNLGKVGEQDIQVQGDTLSMTLPQPEIFDAIINPSDIEVFVEEGSWSHEEVSKIESEAVSELIAHAKAAGILDKARQNGLEQLSNMYKGFGFKVVNLKVNE